MRSTTAAANPPLYRAPMNNLNSLKDELRGAQNSIERVRGAENATPREIGDAMKSLADVVDGLIRYIDDAERERDRAFRDISL